DLDVAVLGLLVPGPFGDGAGHGVRAVLGPAVEVPLAAGSCRTGLPGVPEDLLAGQPHHPLRVQTDHLGDVAVGLLVLLPDGEPQPLGVEAEPALALGGGEELPGEVDRAGLEVVAEGEVARHLEEGAVPRGAADVLDVVGADALLDARGTRV